ncbi:MAG: B12-binding domain-containing radical SAM protein [Myxococcaceae bacterium]|nr:B12-binding domain-containing radical SAM protein [Myxococcaceae bacterium]
MRTSHLPHNHRRILCVFPRYSQVFGTFHHAYQFFPDTKAFMPPQGLLTIAAYLPASWEVKFVDENVREPTDEEFRWADAIFVSSMHVQKRRVGQIAARAHEFGKVCALGGPSVSAAPEYYPMYDYLHCGELGDATDALVRQLDETVARPEKQVTFKTDKRVELDDFPIPAYEKIKVSQYFAANIQWSSGCPYRCEFCDIPELYGRNPRLKSPERMIRELDALMANGARGAIYFVDDNFIGNKKAAKELLPHLIEWQKRHNYAIRLAAELTLNVAQDTEVLELMREAYFTDVFFGIESPDEETLDSIDKQQNLRMPILEAIRIINAHGIELHAGIILGLDADGVDAADKIIRFIDKAQIPLLAVNVLYALPKTPLYRRLQKEGRLIETADVDESNVVFKLPENVVVEQWKKVVKHVFDPENLHARYRHNIVNTYPNRKKVPLLGVVNKRNLHIAAHAISSVFVNLGLKANYKPAFWKMAIELMREGRIDHLIYIATMGHHLITWGQEVADGRARAANYTERPIEEELERRLSNDPRRMLFESGRDQLRPSA